LFYGFVDAMRILGFERAHLQRNQSINATNRQFVAHRLYIRARLDGLQERLRPCLRFAVFQMLENRIFETRQPFWQPEFYRIARMIVGFERATDGAALAILPTQSLHEIVCRAVQADARYVFVFDCLIVVER